jgi:hypothetical protein
VTPSETVSVDFSGIGIQVAGVDPRLAAGLRDVWKGFTVAAVHDPVLVVEVEDDPAPLTPGRQMAAGSRASRDAAGVRLARNEGGVSIDAAAGRAHVRLASGDDGRRIWGLVNLVNAALGFALERHGGGLLHAAGIVLAGRAFVLVGAEGAGKTTFARVAAGAGLPVLSDDQVVVVASGGRCDAVAAPIRHRDFPGPGPGRWPIAAFLLPVHGAPSAISPAGRLDLMARLAANLLYGTPLGHGETLDRLAAGAPARWLTFAPEPSFLRLLEAEQ